MDIEGNKSLKCPKCSNNSFELKREATYLYTYQIDSAEKEAWLNKTEVLPFLFDNREQIHEVESLICKKCSATFPCSLNKNINEMKLIILQKALRSDYQDTPQFFG